MEYSGLYLSIRNELVQDLGKINSVQSWAVALAGGVSLYALQILSNTPKELCALGQTCDLALIAFTGGAILNFFLWILVNNLQEGILRTGRYLLDLEHREKLSKGWEHYVWLRTAKGLRSRGNRLASDVIFWVMSYYIIALVYLGIELQNDLAIVYIAIASICMLIGIYKRVNEFKERRRIYQDMSQFLNDEKEWYDVIHDRFSK